MMNIIPCQQGSDEWMRVRAKHYTASEAPAALGVSKFKTRSELLREKATGLMREIDANTRRRFDAGHAAEESARGIVEELLGEELYPCVGTLEVEGLPLLASMDGLTMDEATGWECKLYNKDLEHQILNEQIEPHYYWQLEQQMLVSGCEKIVFTTSDGTAENTVSCTYTSKPERRAQLVAGWKQFAEDLGKYQHVEVIPAAVAAPIEGFGALVLNVEGRVLACNLDAFNAGARAFIDRLPKASDLTTDQNFADAEAAAKACADAELRIKAAKDAAMAQAADIDQVFRAVDLIAEEIRQARLALEKAVKARKESIRVEIMQDAQAKLAEHVKNLNERIGWHNGCPIISSAAADFASAIKGKKTVASLRDACDTELARAKIATSELADRIEANRKAMGDHAALFPDFTHVCTKTPDDFANLVAVRVQQQKEAEAKREADCAEAERKAQAAACAVNDAPAPQPNLAAEYMRNNPPPSPNASSLDADEPAIWRQAKSGVVAMLDSLTISELEAVADYINRKAWRRAA